VFFCLDVHCLSMLKRLVRFLNVVNSVVGLCLLEGIHFGVSEMQQVKIPAGISTYTSAPLGHGYRSIRKMNTMQWWCILLCKAL
jgi:hypothetical protein